MATALRPRSGTEIIDAAFAILRAHFVPLTTLSVATHLPALAVRLLLSSLRTGNPLEFGGSPLRLTGNIAALVLVFASSLPVIAAASQCYLGDPYDATAAIRRALQRFVPSLLAYALWTLVFLAGLVVLVIPGLYIAIRSIPFSAVGVLEDGPTLRIISRTWDLTYEEVSHVLVAYLPLFAIFTAVYFLNAWALRTLGSNIAMLHYASLYAIYQTALSAILYPFVHVVNVALYYDLRFRKEGFDIALISRELDTPAAAV